MSDALMVTSSFLPGRGGIESYLAALCEELAPRVAVMAPARRDGTPLPTDLPYRTEPGPPLMLVPRPQVGRAIVAAAREMGTERVIFGTPWPLVLLAPMLSRAGIAYAVIAHGAELIVPSAVPGLAARVATALSGADVLFAVSDYTAAKMSRFLSHKGHRTPPMHTLRARVDVDRFRPDIGGSRARQRYGISGDDKVVLCFGRIVARKGIDRLIEALPAIRQRVPRAVLVVAGTGPEERRLRKMAENDGVIFTGRVPDELAPDVYAMADVFALAVADRYRGLEVEGLGIVLLEAAACGVPCVTGRSGGTPEAVIDGSTGFVIDALDRAALVDRIAGLLENPNLAKQMGSAGRKHVVENFHGTARLEPLLDWLNG
ncbi:MAG: glycosyltransferase family 4 protein [Actinobacteria bacterium]|nr:glycosyltransferase family 4 protein [Actinomycetota bacterium]